MRMPSRTLGPILPFFFWILPLTLLLGACSGEDPTPSASEPPETDTPALTPTEPPPTATPTAAPTPTASPSPTPSPTMEDTPTPEPALRDRDGDGVTVGQGDCNDDRADIRPGAPEGRDRGDGVLQGDGEDNNCNNIVDDGTDAYDDDGDGATEDGASGDGTFDCDDSSSLARPGRDEQCSGVDNDCDGRVDNVQGEGRGCVTGTVRCETTSSSVACGDAEDCADVNCVTNDEGEEVCAPSSCDDTGHCLKTTCETDASAASGGQTTGAGDSLVCDGDGDCPGGTYCLGGICEAECETDTECGELFCTQSGRCGACSVDLDCTGGKICTAEGMCVRRECRTDSECDDGFCTLQGLCEDFSGSDLPAALSLAYHPCDAPDLLTGELAFPRGVGVAEICLSVLDEDGAPLSAGSPIPTVFAVLAQDATLSPDRSEPLLSLAFPEVGGVTHSEDRGTWALSLTPGTPLKIEVHLGDAPLDRRLEIAPTLRAASTYSPADLSVFIPGDLGGAFKGVMIYDNGILPDRPFTALVDPSTYPEHALVLPAEMNTLSGTDIAGSLIETSQTGNEITLLWWEALDLSALADRIGGPLSLPLIDRPMYRRFELTLTEAVSAYGEGDGYEGTFTETLRGLAPRDIIFTGSVTFEGAGLLTARYAGVLGDPSDAFWAAPSLEADFAAGALSPSPTLSETCRDIYPYGAGGIGRPRCLLEGGEGCAFEGPAEVLSAHLEGVDAGMSDTDPEYVHTRYASTGVCDVELDLFFKSHPYAPSDEGVRRITYDQMLAYAPSGGSCEGAVGTGEATSFQLGDPGFAPCCVDPNRLYCAAEYYALLSGFGAPSETTSNAQSELWTPLRHLIAAHIYDLQEMRVLNRESELIPSGGQVPTFSLEDRRGRAEAAVARLLPALGAIMEREIITGLDASAAALGERCAGESPCAYQETAEQLASALAAHMEAVEELAEVWQQERDDVDTRGAWLQQVGQVELLLGAYIAQLGEDGGAPLPDATLGRLRGLRAQGGRLETLGDRLQRGINPWGYPDNYIPNPTTTSGNFAARLRTAASWITTAGGEEAYVMAGYRSALASRAEELAGVDVRLERLRDRRGDLCGRSGLEPLSLERCGETQGELYDAFQELSAKIEEEERAGRIADAILERIRIKQAEAGATVAAYQELGQTYAANAEALDADLSDMQAVFEEGWQTRFDDYQDQRDAVYESLQTLYTDLAADNRAALEELRAEKQANLTAKCSAMASKIITVRSEQLQTRGEACEEIVGCLQKAEAKRAKRKKRRRIFKAIKTLGASELARAAKGSGGRDGCKESCRQETECEAEAQIAQSDALLELGNHLKECSAADRDIALEGDQQQKALWARESAELGRLAAEHADARIQDFYNFREEKMRFQLERQEQRAQRSAQLADAQAGVEARVKEARAHFEAEVEMLLVDLAEQDAVLEELQGSVDLSTDRLARLFELAEAAFDEEGRLETALGQLQMTDPTFRLVETEDELALEASLDLARRYTWLALRAYEFETSARFAYRDLLDGAVTSRQLCQFAQCLDATFDVTEDAFGSPQDATRRVFSARTLLGLDEAVVDPRSGDRISPARRFGQHLTHPRQLYLEPGNGVTRRVRIQTHSTPGSAWSWDATRCNEKIESIQVLILCEGCTPNEEVQMRAQPGGAMLHHSCAQPGERDFDAPADLAGWEATLFAGVTAAPAGGIQALTSADWAKATPNTQLSGLNPMFPSWFLTLVPPESQPLNRALTLGAVEDIVLRINYVDQSATPWGGVLGSAPSCQDLVSDDAFYNAVDTWSCDIAP